MEHSTTNSHPPTLIGLFPRHEGRAVLKALIMETTPVSICPYLSAFVVAVPGRGLSHTKTHWVSVSVFLLLWPPCGSTYLNLNSNYLSVTTFLKHARANTLTHRTCTVTAHALLQKQSQCFLGLLLSCAVCRLQCYKHLQNIYGIQRIPTQMLICVGSFLLHVCV